MATDNKQKVLIRSMSIEEIEKYMINSDLNGKITPKNEDTWHQNYDGIRMYGSGYIASIIQNTSILANYFIFLNRYVHGDTLKYRSINRSTDNFWNNLWGGVNAYATPVFRPLIEYKE